MIENFLPGLASGGLAGAAVVWLTKSVLTERIKNSIKHEYDTVPRRLKHNLTTLYATA